MIRIFLLVSVLAGVLFYRYPAVSYDAPPDFAVSCSDFLSSSDYQTLLNEKGPVFYSRGKRIPLKDEGLYFVPPEGNGYFQYQKIGRDIEFLAAPDEPYWKRESASYPVSDPEGKWILLLSGDLTTVRLMDHNGNAASGKPLSGVLMTDYAFNRGFSSSVGTGAAAAVLFSSGPVYIVRFEPSFRVFTLEIPDSEKSFAKSVAIGTDRIAIHLQQQDQDYIREYTLDEEKERLSEKESVRLSAVIPHRIAMALTQTGVVFATGRMVGQITDGSIAYLTNPSGRLPTDESAGEGDSAEARADGPREGPAEVPTVAFQGDALGGVGLTVVGGERFLYIVNEAGLSVATALHSASPYRLLYNKNGISVEDENGYCTIRPSASR